MNECKLSYEYDTSKLCYSLGVFLNKALKANLWMSRSYYTLDLEDKLKTALARYNFSTRHDVL